MSISNDYLEFCADRLRVLGKVSFKRMFGGAGFYLNGRMFALTDGDTIYLKADDENRARFESRKMEAFAPFADQPDKKMSYYSLSSEDLEDDDALRELGLLAVEASARAAQKMVGAGPRPARSKTKRAKTKS